MNDDLISRSLAVEEFYKRIGGDLDADEVYYIEKVLNKIPVAYDVDNVIGQLENLKNQYIKRAAELKSRIWDNYESQRNYAKAYSYDLAAEIVKSERRLYE